ncbi:MAG: hypothetical protein JRG86_14185 [Deltaproteobacteria bacterium]|nr:hypothetical protein [Deltaproteobacteria bacterium]
MREAGWPAQLDDVVAAVRWATDHADALGVDVDRFVVSKSVCPRSFISWPVPCMDSSGAANDRADGFGVCALLEPGHDRP